MTHSLHRRGSRENLSNDFVMYLMPSRGINDAGSASKKRCFLEIALRNNVVNAGGTDLGNLLMQSPREMRDKISDFPTPVAICCARKEDVVNILREALEADFGLSIMVQGVFEEVEDCLRQVGLKMHTVNQSLGVWGKTEKLPPKEVLEIATMCGHGLVSTNLVKKAIGDVISGSATPSESARLLAHPCVCGLFNISRCEALLERIASRARLGS